MAEAGLGLVEPSGCHKINGSTTALGGKPVGADRGGGAATPKPSLGPLVGLARGVAGLAKGVVGAEPVAGVGDAVGVWARTGAASKAITAAAPRVIGWFGPMVALPLCR